MIRALITDFGGVLVRTRTDAPRRALEAQLGLPPHTLEERVFNGDLSQRAQRGAISADAFWNQIGLNLKLDGRLRPAEFRDRFFSADFLDDDLIALIRGVRPAIKTGLISNAWGDARRGFVHTYSLADIFDVIVISAEEGVMKPDPRIYRAAIQRLGVQAAESIFVDDVLANVRGAQAVGMHGVHFQSTEQAQQEIRQLLGSIR
jgi:putative hydrolase of the HAD superfamily